MKKKQYKCKCCNYYTLDDYPFDICPICCWENSGIDALEVSLWTEDILGNKIKFYSDSLKKEIPSYKYRIQKSD